VAAEHGETYRIAPMTCVSQTACPVMWCTWTADTSSELPVSESERLSDGGSPPIGNQSGERIVELCMRRLRSVIAVSALTLAACSSTADTGDDALVTARLEITALAGPVCPVETDPPSPECAPRPVDSATIVITDAHGDEVARGTTGSNGVVGFDVAPGELTVVSQPIEGLLGTASMVSVTLTAGQTPQVTVDYDTGIR
jgi:hypothetical protein